jgi:hypothetical protein
MPTEINIRVTGDASQAVSELQRLGAALNGMSGTSVVAARSISGLESQLGSATARLGAITAGAGQFGYALSIVARAVPELGSALAVAFPLVIAGAFVEIISKMVEKFQNLSIEARKTQEEFIGLASAQVQEAQATELQNLKLDDEISKLEGRPVQNRLAEAVIEARQEVDKLTASFVKANEQELELLEKQGTGFFNELITGAEETDDVFKQLKPSLEAVEKASLQLQIANNAVALSDTALTRDAQSKAEQRVKDAIKEAQDKVSAIRDGIAQQKALQEQSGAVPGVKGSGAVGKPVAEVEAAFAGQDIAVLSTTQRLQAFTAALKAAHEESTKKTTIAGLEDWKDAYTSLHISQEQAIKDIEKAGLDRATAEKQGAELQFKAVQDGLKQQVEAVQSGGEQRSQAELSAIPKLVAAKETENAALLQAAKTAYEARNASLQAEREAATDNPDEAKRRDAINHIDAQILSAYNEYINSRTALEQKGQDDLLEIQNRGAALRIAAAKEQARLLAEADRRSEELTGRSNEGALRAGEMEIRSIQEQASIGDISRQREINQIQSEIDLLRIKKQAALDALQAEVKKETTQQVTPVSQGGFQGDSTQLAASQQRVAELNQQIQAMTTSTSAWDAAINRASTDLNRLSESGGQIFQRMSNSMLAAGVSWKSVTVEFTQSWTSALNQVNNQFASSVGQWIERGGSFGRAMQNMGASLVADQAQQWIKFGLVMLETWLKSLIVGKATTTTQTATVTAAQAVQTTAVTTAQAAQTVAVTTAQGAQAAATVLASSIEATAASTAAATAAIAAKLAQTAYAGEGAAAAGSAVAGIPIIGPALAIAAATTTFAVLESFQHGGHVPGTGKGDSVHAMLEPGEFVMRSDVVGKPGVLAHLMDLNSGHMKLAGGGTVGFSGGMYSHGGMVSPAPQFSHFAAGGPVNFEAGDHSSSTSTSNNRFQFHQEINGAEKTTEEMGEEMFQYMRGRLARMGLKV